MGFPIAIGTKSVASRPVVSAEPVEEFANDGIRILRPSDPTVPTVFVANSADQELLALVTLSYYRMRHDEETEAVEYCVAELRVQIVPTAQGTSLNNRDDVHRVKLPSTSSSSDEAKQDTPMAHSSMYQTASKPMAVFSFDKKFLTCLIPHPASYDSTVVVFQLRRPKEPKKKLPAPPLPSYIASSVASTDSLSYVATKPSVLVLEKYEGNGESKPLLSVSSLVDVRTFVIETGPTMLLLGTRDGSILLASYRPLLLLGTLYGHPFTSNIEPLALISGMDHVCELCDYSHGLVKGRLAVVSNNGSVEVFQSHIRESAVANKETKKVLNDDQYDRLVALPDSGDLLSSTPIELLDGDLTMGLTKSHRLQNSTDKIGEPLPSFCQVKWINSSYLAVLQSPDITCTTSVYIIDGNGQSASIATNVMTPNYLEDTATTKLHFDSLDHLSNGDPQSPRIDTGDSFPFHLEYDAYSDCLAISAYLLKTENRRPILRYPFVCLWNWRTNAVSMSAFADLNNRLVAICASSLHFAVDTSKQRKLVHLSASAVQSHHSVRICKETYDLGIWSPPSSVAIRGDHVHEAEALLLTATSVSYPRRNKTSTRENFEVKWADTIIPSSYISSYGAPCIATIGKSNNRSVAIASSRSLCILEEPIDLPQQNLGSIRQDTDESFRRQEVNDDSITKLLRMKDAPPKWHLFGNETGERDFRVVAMTWWEGFACNGTTDGKWGTIHTDDVLVAVIERYDSQKAIGCYLSCWTGRSFEHSRQLLCAPKNTNNGTYDAKWGIPIPADFVPASLDILACPFRRDATHGSSLPRKACVLLTARSVVAPFRIYDLQAVPTEHDGFVDVNNYSIFTHCSATGLIESAADLFLASASFAFCYSDSVETKDAALRDVTQDVSSAAILGVVRACGAGVDAVMVHGGNIVAVGQVVDAVDCEEADFRESELSRMWLADILFDRPIKGTVSANFFTWVLQLASGRLVSWSIPFVNSIEHIFLLLDPFHSFIEEMPSMGTNTVHPKGISLGMVSPAGTTSSWMQQSTKGSREDFLAGHVPKSPFGYAIGVAQHCRKLHRSAIDDLERDLFRGDFFDHELFGPSDFVLYPPTFLPSTYSLLLDSCGVDLEGKIDYVDRHLQRKLCTPSLQNITIMSLQLLMLRSVEKVAAIGTYRGAEANIQKSLLRSILGSIKAIVRNQTSPLQFSTLLLKIARQLEPKCLPYLFPLSPSSTSSSSSNSTRSLGLVGGGETPRHLFETSLHEGSISVAVSALPLLLDQTTIQTMCTRLFYHFLNKWDACFATQNALTYFEFCLPQDELIAMVDVFRYAMKLSKNDSATDDEDEGLVPERGYSIMCGLSNIFSRSGNKGRGPTLNKYNRTTKPVAIPRLIPWNRFVKSASTSGATTVAAATSRYVLSTLLLPELGCPLDNARGWRAVGALAVCLTWGDDSSTTPGKRTTSTTALTRCIETTSLVQYENLIHPMEYYSPLGPNGGSTNRKSKSTEGLTEFLKDCIQCCGGCHVSGSVMANAVWDLLRLLLEHATALTDYPADIPGLVLLGLVAAHVAGRSAEVGLVDDDLDDPEEEDGIRSVLWRAYRHAVQI